MNNYFKKYLKYKKKYLNFTGGSDYDINDDINAYRTCFNEKHTEDAALNKLLYYKIRNKIKCLYFNNQHIESTVTKFVFYIKNPDFNQSTNYGFTDNKANNTENSIATMKEATKYLKPDVKEYLQFFDDSKLLSVFNIFIDYIYKLLLSDYDVWHEIFNHVLDINLPSEYTESNGPKCNINPNMGCSFVMGTVMRRLGINIFHDGMTQLYFKSIYSVYLDNEEKLFCIKEEYDQSNYFVYGKYDGTQEIKTQLADSIKYQEGYTRFLILSDTHNCHDKITLKFPQLNIDVLIHAGDLYYEQSRGIIKTLKTTNLEIFEWLKKTNIKDKLIISGNHDYVLEQSEINDTVAQTTNLTTLMANYEFTYLNNKVIKHIIKGNEFDIYGYGFRQGTEPHDKRTSRTTSNNAFEFTQDEIRDKVNESLKESTNLDIIITHGVACKPPEIHKYNKREAPKRCVDISQAIETFKPKLCVAGDEHKKYFSTSKNTDHANLKDILEDSIQIYTYDMPEDSPPRYGIFVNAPVLNQYNAFVGYPVILDVNTAWLIQDRKLR